MMTLLARSIGAPKLDPLRATIRDLQNLLEAGVCSSVDLVNLYTTQIADHDSKFRSIISVAPKDKLVARAGWLDEQRSKGTVLGPLHGIPLIVKDNIATHPSSGMRTSCGNLAFQASVCPAEADVVSKLQAHGALIIAKANMSELMNAKGSGVRGGWSAVGGQCSSAYVEGGIDESDKPAGHSCPGGSSTGSAVAVSVGFAPASIGTETAGSLTEPAARAAVYTLKPGAGKVSNMGVCPVSRALDTSGPMARCVYDIAILCDAIFESQSLPSSGTFTTFLGGQWKDFRIGTLDPALWRKNTMVCDRNSQIEADMDKDTFKAYTMIKENAKSYKHFVDLASGADFRLDGSNSLNAVVLHDYHKDLEDYMAWLSESPVHSIAELVEFNIKHADQELPPHRSSQSMLETAKDYFLSPEDYQKNFATMRRLARDQGIEKTLHDNDIDAIIGPADSDIAWIVAGAGYPCGVLPLGFSSVNCRAHGLEVVARSEEIVLAIMSAWESSFSGGVRPPKGLPTSGSAC